MKILGQASNGGTIVELSEQETTILRDLQDAIAGATWTPRPPRGIAVEGNIEKAFLAILNFVQAKYAINELRNVVDNLDKIIGLENE